MTKVKGVIPDSVTYSQTNAVSVPQCTDVFIGFATPKGYVSWLHKDYGSWYIYTVLWVLARYSHNTHLVDMMTKVLPTIRDLFPMAD